MAKAKAKTKAAPAPATRSPKAKAKPKPKGKAAAAALPILRAITIWQPYASLLAAGHKTIETRTWATAYRGPLVIHASAFWNRELAERLEQFNKALVKAGREPLAPPLPRGGIVGVVNLLDCSAAKGLVPDPLNKLFGDFGPGRFAWSVGNAAPLAAPIECAGARRLWPVPPELVRAIVEALPGYDFHKEAPV